MTMGRRCLKKQGQAPEWLKLPRLSCRDEKKGRHRSSTEKPRMHRREFSQAAASMAALAFWGRQPAQAAGQPEAKMPPTAIGTNLSGLEWAAPGLRHSLSSAPNIHFTVPRKADVAYLAACGFTKNRLPVQWELLQPILPGTPANPAARKLIGEPGSLHAGYAAYITGLLDAHAASGMR
ncbi:MAG: hypothetical protein H7345_02195, partial [Rubritepida sp.]|nr:hypothetical protein [Rubritepida sp.]